MRGTRQAALLHSLQDRGDRFLLGRIDESAGIHHQHVGFSSIAGDAHSPFQHAAEHDLRVDQILGTTETNHANLC
jgi:hypothetical protein